MDFEKTYMQIVYLEDRIKSLPAGNVSMDMREQLYEELQSVIDDFYDYSGKYSPEKLFKMPGFYKCSTKCAEISRESLPTL